MRAGRLWLLLLLPAAARADGDLLDRLELQFMGGPALADEARGPSRSSFSLDRPGGSGIRLQALFGSARQAKGYLAFTAHLLHQDLPTQGMPWDPANGVTLLGGGDMGSRWATAGWQVRTPPDKPVCLWGSLGLGWGLMIRDAMSYKRLLLDAEQYYQSGAKRSEGYVMEFMAGVEARLGDDYAVGAALLGENLIDPYRGSSHLRLLLCTLRWAPGDKEKP